MSRLSVPDLKRTRAAQSPRWRTDAAHYDNSRECADPPFDFAARADVPLTAEAMETVDF